MTNASNIIDLFNYYNDCSGDDLLESMRIALSIKRDASASASDRYEADLTIHAIRDIVARRGGF